MAADSAAPRPVRPEANAADAARARRIVAEAPTATLAVIDADGMPYAALTAPAQAADGAILLLTSGLGAHGAALARDGRASLLFQERPAGGSADPLAAARLTVQGSAAPARDGDRADFLARRPEAELYIDFGDMRLWRLEATSLNLIAGFGRAVRLSPDALAPTQAG